ncbi:uncharacterized protein LOC134286529 [Aedes albopictus]|uniref:Secreted protein n=1 Tax=Aedes albopictus TaxID=7160 RepID=A0ABM1ZB29_AEDAL
MYLFLNNIRLHAIVLVLVKTTAAVIPRAGSVQSRSGFVRFCRRRRILLHAIIPVLPQTTAAVIPRPGSVQSRSGFVRFCRRRRILLHAIIPVLPQTTAAVILRPGSVQFRLRSFLSGVKRHQSRPELSFLQHQTTQAPSDSISCRPDCINPCRASSLLAPYLFDPVPARSNDGILPTLF